jgi:hypothetical protein
LVNRYRKKQSYRDRCVIPEHVARISPASYFGRSDVDRTDARNTKSRIDLGVLAGARRVSGALIAFERRDGSNLLHIGSKGFFVAPVTARACLVIVPEVEAALVGSLAGYHWLPCRPAVG